MSDAASQVRQRELLHQLRNRLNVMGFALHALRSETSKPMETLRTTHQAAIQLLNELGEQERVQQLADGPHIEVPPASPSDGR
ncbi:hypothetical protein OEG85_20830 [Xanthomonas hortorum]|uniref:Uncharacterized protein n=2 Tax=Xanthomonas hortorum TaxID=56454 RepID=A0AA47IBG0_9XANT|nr:hypothetical protein OEG85_20830 [Xanthomonas hortorum]